MRAFLLALYRPLVFLNLAALLAGAAWVAMSAQWRAIGAVFALLVFSPYIIPVLLMPSGIFSHFMSQARQQGRTRRERVFFVLSLGYVLVFLAGWSALIFTYLAGGIASGAGLLLGAGAAMLPLLRWISADKDNLFIWGLVALTQLALLLLAALQLVGGWAFALVFGLLALAAAAQGIYEKKTAGR